MCILRAHMGSMVCIGLLIEHIHYCMEKVRRSIASPSLSSEASPQALSDYIAALLHRMLCDFQC